MRPSEQAAMLLFFEISPEAIIEHDHWHSHEHIEERLSIPGFLRATRWRDCNRENSYFVMYEVENIGVLSSPAYLERLNHPSPWTTQIMNQYRGMQRGLCKNIISAGGGLGQGMLTIHFQPIDGKKADFFAWLENEILPVFPFKPGLASIDLYASGITPQMTKEQTIRGKDHDVQWVLLASGYDMKTLEKLAEETLSTQQFENNGARIVSSKCYQLEFLMDSLR